jgi:MarR family transcriptional regulator, transcriptional regulator for hemolysin
MNPRDNTILREPLGRITGKISRVFFGALQKRLSHLDIERSFYPLLLIDDGEGELTQQDLSSKLFSDKVQVVRIVDYLSANGYVERVQNPKDRREYKLHVTDKGRAAVPEIKAVVKELSEIAFKGLSPEKIDELYSTFDLIETNLVCLKNELEQ